jgi:hypothetical protein
VIQGEQALKLNTEELSGLALDWAVAMCYGMASRSTDWAEGGPIIERDAIKLDPITGPKGVRA